MWRLELSLAPVEDPDKPAYIASTVIATGVDEDPIPDIGGFLEAALLAVAESLTLAIGGGFKR